MRRVTWTAGHTLNNQLSIYQLSFMPVPHMHFHISYMSPLPFILPYFFPFLLSFLFFSSYVLFHISFSSHFLHISLLFFLNFYFKMFPSHAFILHEYNSNCCVYINPPILSYPSPLLNPNRDPHYSYTRDSYTLPM